MESRQRIGSVVSSCNRDVSSACNGDMSSRNGDATIDFQESESHEMPSTASDSPHSSPHVMLYGIEDVPPWYLNVTFAFQHYISMFGGTISVPLILAPALCIPPDSLALGELISTFFVVGGIATLLQTLLGSR